jgi:hypothetical protein
MLEFFKRLFGSKPAESTAVPYKVEKSEHFPFPKALAEEKKPAAKKPAAKQPAAKKPRAPRKPKA